MSTRRWFLACLVFALVPVACEPAEEEPLVDETVPMDEAAPAEELPPGAGVAEAPMRATLATEAVEVTNTMPHPMVVSYTVEGESSELGTVAAGATDTVRVRAPEGATVRLTARDTAATHMVETVVTAGGESERWTIGG